MKAIGTIIIGILFFTANFVLAQDSLYVFKAGSVIYKQAVSNIDSVTFKKSNPVVGTVTDIDGNVYHTVTIGTQVWMVESLKTTKYRNGDPIPNVTDNTEWARLNSGAYCNYKNNVENSNKYGKLYNWNAANDSRNIAPIGWHIPTNADWTELSNYVESNIGTSGSVAKALSAKTDWAPSSYKDVIGNDLIKNNSSGFSALPGGLRYGDGSFGYLGLTGVWWGWSKEEYEQNSVWFRFLDYNKSIISKTEGMYRKECGFSIRCVKD